MPTLKSFLPELPAIVEHSQRLGQLSSFIELSKSSNSTYRNDTIGIDQISTSWLRQSMGYRVQLLQDIMTIAMTVEEIRAPILHITSEVFRRGINWKPKFAQKCTKCSIEYNEHMEVCEQCNSADYLAVPNEQQKQLLEPFLKDCNIFDQSLEDVLRECHFDVNSTDDAFLYFEKEYFAEEKGPVRSRITGIRRLNPALVEIDLDGQGLPKNKNFVCYLHRDTAPVSEPGDCSICGRKLVPVMYTLWFRGAKKYLLDSEVCHISKFSPSPLYGFSPILTIFEKALTIIGADKNLYRFFWERKMPACYDDKTEVLTNSGWKLFHNLEKTDKLLTLADDGRLCYETPTRFVASEYHGPMYQINARGVSLLVTPNHNIYSRRRGDNQFSLEQAATLFGKDYGIWRGSGKWDGERQDYFTLPAANSKKNGADAKTITISLRTWASLLGIWYAAGYGTKYSITIQALRHSEFIRQELQEIEALIYSGRNSRLEIHAKVLGDFFAPYIHNRESLLTEVKKLPFVYQHKFYSTAMKVLSEHPNNKSNLFASRLTALNTFGKCIVEDVTNPSYEETITLSNTRNSIYKPAMQIPMDDWLRFLGIYIAEGSVSNQGYKVSISQYKPASFAIMWDWVQKLPFDWHIMHEDGKPSGMFCSDVRLFSYVKQLGRSKGKFLPQEYKALPPEQLQILWDAWVLGDAGTTASAKLRDDMMEVALKCGWGTAYYSENYSTDRGTKGAINYLRVYKDEADKVQNINHTSQQDSWVQYDGMVYCVEVPSHTMFIRREGKVIVSGNSMLMVFTDDPESLRRERIHLAAQMKADPNYIPMVAVSAKNNRGRVDMVRLFHTLQEMDYLPVREEIRERIGAMWGVTPVWQGAPEAFGGLSQQTSQLSVMSRVVEGDQRLFHTKVFPHITEAFGITDWELELPQPEEKAESTRLAFAQQRISAAQQLASMGFMLKIKSPDVGIADIDFIVAGQNQMPQQQGFAPEQPQEQGASDQQQQSEQPKSQEAAEQPTTAVNKMLLKSSSGGWYDQILQKGYTGVEFKAMNDVGDRVWFKSGGLDYVAQYNPSGQLLNVEKAVFKIPARKILRRKKPIQKQAPDGQEDDMDTPEG